MARRKKRRASASGQGTFSPPVGPDVAVVLAHGIGWHKPGGRLTTWAGPVVKAIGALAPDSAPQCGAVFALPVSALLAQEESKSPQTVRTVPAMDVTFVVRGRRQSVRFVEGNWHVPLTSRRVVAALWEFVTLLPLVALLVAFDRRDREGLASLNGGASKVPPTDKGRFSTRLTQLLLDPLRQMEEFSPFFRVMARVLVGFALTSWGVSWVLSLGWAGVPVGAAFAAIFMFLLVPLIGQVLAAATDGGDIDQVSEQISEAIRYVSVSSRRTLVVGHSQGGYLAHRALTPARKGSPRVDALIGIGSGVKPIHLIHQIRTHRLRGAMWLVAAGAALGPLAALVTIDWKLPIVVREWFYAATTLAGAAFTEPLPQEMSARLKPLGELSWRKVNPFDGVVLHPSWWTVALLLVWAGAVLLLRRVASKLSDIRPISALPGVDWAEVTSHSDFVGRLLHPGLPERVQELDVTLGANPLLDHLTYFKTFSEVPRIIAAKVIALACRDQKIDASILEENRALTVAGKRRRRARAAAVWAPLMISVIVPMLVQGATLNSCVIALAPRSAGQIGFCAVALWATEVAAQRGVVIEPIRGGVALRRALHAQRVRTYVYGQPLRIVVTGSLAFMLLVGAVPFYSAIAPGRRLATACLWMATLLIFYAAARACGYLPNPYIMGALFLLLLQDILASVEFLAHSLTRGTGIPVRLLDVRGSMPLILLMLLVGALLAADLPVVRRLLRRPPPPPR